VERQPDVGKGFGVVSTQAPVSGAAPAVGGTLGSFELVERAGAWESQTRFRARGRAGTSHAGAEALVICRALAPAEKLQADAILDRLQRLASLRHEAIAPVFEVGGWEDGVYVAHSWPGPQTLAGRLGQVGGLPLARVVPVLEALASALDAAAAGGVAHGDVRLANVWQRGDGRPLLGGFRLVPGEEVTAANDASGLAAVAASLLAGKPIAVVPAGAEVPPEQRWDPFGLPEAVRLALGRGFGADPAARYPSAGVLAEAVREATAVAVKVQVAGAWDAIERRDYPMAQMLSEAALVLQPTDPEIARLVQHVRTHTVGNLPVSAFDFAAPLALAGEDETERPSAPLPPPSASAISAVPGLSDLPPELAALLAPPPPSNTNPTHSWMMLALGMVLLFLMTLVVGSIAIFS
jgi:hypothetical protein